MGVGGGRPSNRRIPAGRRAEALRIVRDHYADFGPTLAHEKLTEAHALRLSVETLRRWIAEDGLWLTRAKRRDLIQQPRRRRACIGELIQIDGSDRMHTLSLDSICANTPAAKGRVERANLTLQATPFPRDGLPTNYTRPLPVRDRWQQGAAQGPP